MTECIENSTITIIIVNMPMIVLKVTLCFENTNNVCTEMSLHPLRRQKKPLLTKQHLLAVYFAMFHSQDSYGLLVVKTFCWCKRRLPVCHLFCLECTSTLTIVNVNLTFVEGSYSLCPARVICSVTSMTFLIEVP